MSMPGSSYEKDRELNRNFILPKAIAGGCLADNKKNLIVIIS